jgi:hypothetical protein
VKHFLVPRRPLKAHGKLESHIASERRAIDDFHGWSIFENSLIQSDISSRTTLLLQESIFAPRPFTLLRKRNEVLSEASPGSCRDAESCPAATVRDAHIIDAQSATRTPDHDSFRITSQRHARREIPRPLTAFDVKIRWSHKNIKA